jgi:hypothetical protein
MYFKCWAAIVDFWIKTFMVTKIQLILEMLEIFHSDAVSLLRMEAAERPTKDAALMRWRVTEA